MKSFLGWGAAATLALWALLAPTRAIAQDAAVSGEGPWPVNPEAAPRPVATATPVTEPIVVDGRLDEPAWARAEPLSNFVQSTPRTGYPATQRTVVRILYDAEHLFIGAVCYDTEIGRMMIAGLEHDFNPGAGDIFGVTLDTFHDRRNSFLFLVNPGGALRDEHTMNDSRNINVAWDAIASVRTAVTDSAWIVELAIPLTTLRFDASRAEQTWGVNFLRRVRRANESSYWAPLDRREVLHRMSRAGRLTGLQGLRPGRNLKLKPYVVSNYAEGRRAPAPDGDVDYDAGADLKLGLGAGLTLDLTYRTDFSQVEVDQEQVNLTRFSLFFPERRDFFVENAGAFSFGDVTERNYRMGSSLQEFTLFHSRRIGLTPDGQPIPILGGARLTGRLGSSELGLLTMQTRATATTPAENFAVARFRRNVLGSSDVGVIVLNRHATDGVDGPWYNRSVGVDANLRILRNRMVINSYLAATDAPDSAGDGVAGRVSLAWRDWLWNASGMVKHVDDSFNPGVGFVRRRGMRHHYGTVGLHPRPAVSWIQELNSFVELDYITDTGGRLETRQATVGFGVSFVDASNVSLEFRDQLERLVAPFPIFTGVVIPEGDYAFRDLRVTYASSQAEKVTGRLSLSTGDFWSGSRRSASLSASWRPRHDLFFELSANRNDVDLPEGSFTADLISGRVRFATSTRFFGSAFVQYNAETDQLVSNLRLDFRHAPLSDVFLVLVDRRDMRARTVLERSVALKVTRLFAF